MNDTIKDVLTFAGFVLAVLVGVFTAFKYFTAEIKASAVNEAKERHKMGNQWQVALSRVEIDIQTIERNASQLALDAARKSDLDKSEIARKVELQALETRFTEAVRDTKVSLTHEIHRLEETRREATNKLDEKFEALSEKVMEVLVDVRAKKRTPST